MFSIFNVCFAKALRKFLWVFILPMSSIPYSAGYVEPSLLCLNLTTCSALSPSNFWTPAFKFIYSPCFLSVYFMSIGTSNVTPPIASTNALNASVSTFI